MRDFKRRLLTSSIVIPILGLLIYFSQTPVVTLLILMCVATLAGLGVWEYLQFTKKKKIKPSTKLVVLLAVALVLAAFISEREGGILLAPLIVLVIGAMAIFLSHFRDPENAIFQTASEFFGLCYVAVPLSFIFGILYPVDAYQDGRLWFVYLILVTKITDMGAYFTGKLLGRRKLAAALSPKKTIEGSVGGFLFSVAASVCMHYLGLPISLVTSLWLGALLAILAQVGDLAESLLKRDAGVKDSNTLPGLGGVLDTVDSLLFTIPVLYLFLEMTT